MSDKELEIFNLCERLAELLGDKEAIADLKRLYDKHPEMFNNMQEVSSTIKEVVEKPEIIVDANRGNRDYKVIKAAKALNDERMADVVIKNESGTNEIFHTNKKRIKEFDRLKNRENLLQVETPTPSTRQLNGLELMDENPFGANALSATTNDIIAQSQDKAEQNQTQSQANFDANEFNTLSLSERLAQLQRNQESISQMPKVSEVLKGDSNSLQNPKEQKYSKDLQQENDSRELESKESTFKHQHKRK